MIKSMKDYCGWKNKKNKKQNHLKKMLYLQFPTSHLGHIAKVEEGSLVLMTETELLAFYTSHSAPSTLFKTYFARVEKC